MPKMIAYTGQAFLGVALLLAIFQACGSRFRVRLAYGQALCVFLAFALLMYAHVTDQFALLSVVLHSHAQKPLLYKISGVWGNHEGSMLLWVLILTLYGAAVVRQVKNLGRPYTLAAPVMGLVNVTFLAFILMACDPFAMVESVPLQGQDLNPLLQDPSLAIHPPCLYLGYVGFAVPFAFAVLVLIRGEMPSHWVAHLRPWVLFAWTFLTLGLGLGSFWAYYELGWGGWWFWDPVENAALMPWLTATALVHALRVLETTQALKAWTLFLCLLTFALCLFGTFLVRSGLLTSIHSFAVDPMRGLFILILSGFLIFPPLGLFLWRLPILRSNQLSIPSSRSGMILLMTLILISATVTVAFGTLYPLILEVFGQKITVGAPYYALTFVPMMLPLLFLNGLGPWYGWAAAPLAWPWILPLVSATILTLLVLYFGGGMRHGLGLAALAGAVWVILTTLAYALKHREIFSGMIMAHLGVGITVLGIVGSSLGEQEIVKAVRIGESFDIGAYALTLEKVEKHQGANYQAQRATLTVTGYPETSLMPEKRFYWTKGVIHGESAIRSFGLHHLYITLGEEYEGDQWSLHAYIKSYINLLWIGGLLIVLGGAIAFLKRFRISFLLALVLLQPTFSLDAHEQLADPVLEVRARFLSQRLLCPVCQGQTLDESQVEMAVLLRRQIRTALQQGQSDQKILEDFMARYGAHVVVTPLVGWSTYALWFGPWVVFLMVMGGCFFRLRKLNNGKKTFQ
jgi:cytochrome c-type biogenesis protein CcmF